ncbi:hypothetical protein ACSBR2_011179 [Camellia fascicularis]
MFSLAKSFELEHIDVLVQRKCYESSIGGCVVDSRTDETDLLPLYCTHKSKTFLSAGWALGITHVGQLSGCGANEFQMILCKYAVECSFQFKYIKNDSVQIIVVCKFATPTGCPWLVHARVSASNGILCLKSFNNLHSCGVVVKTYRNSQTGSDLVSDVIADHVREQPITRSTNVVFDMKNGYGLDVRYRVAWLGVEKARSAVYGDHAMLFYQLRWYSDAVMENNPHETWSFIRYFIAFRACMDGFKHCYPLLFLGGTFLKGRIKGTLLAATAKDDNQGLLPVAFAAVDADNASNWEWFLSQFA